MDTFTLTSEEKKREKHRKTLSPAHDGRFIRTRRRILIKMELDGGNDSDNSDNIYGKTNFVEENCSFNFVSDIRFWGSSSRAEGLKQFFDVLTVRRKCA